MPPRRRPSRILTLPAVTVAALILLLVTLGRADAPEDHYSTGIPEVVVDTKTGLHWQRDATGPVSWANAVQHCENFNAELQTWRLPSMKELQTLVDEAKTQGPLIDPLFTGTDGADWSSTEIFGIPDQVYVVNIGVGSNGDAVPLDKRGLGVARCVRP